MAEGAKDGKVTLFEMDPLVCSFGTPWLDHWGPPIGTGKGCVQCDTYEGEPTKGKR